MTDLSNKVSLVTGSTRGIGKSIALLYAGLGADVVIDYTEDKTSADATVKEIEGLGKKALSVQCNVASTADITRAFLKLQCRRSVK
jgi:3-oxoacyl-[acyl-carrier protein] reductase